MKYTFFFFKSRNKRFHYSCFWFLHRYTLILWIFQKSDDLSSRRFVFFDDLTFFSAQSFIWEEVRQKSRPYTTVRYGFLLNRKRF